MAYHWKIDENLDGSKSWTQYYTRLGPICWKPESMFSRIIHGVLFIPWVLLWMAGLMPAILILGVIGGFYNYIRYNEFLP